MRFLVVALRVIEAVLLVGIVYEVSRTVDSSTTSIGMFQMGFELSVRGGSNEFVLNSAWLGYPVALAASLLSMKGNRGPHGLSILLSSVFLASAIYSVVRWYGGYGLDIRISAPIVLVVVDAIATKAYLFGSSGTSSNDLVSQMESGPRVDQTKGDE